MTRPRWSRAALGLFATALLAQVGCHKSHVEGTVSSDAVVQAFTDIGYDAQGVKSVEPDAWSAGFCAEGSITGLDVLVCEFTSDEAMAKAEQRLHDQWNANNVDTAVVARNGRTLLSIADAKKADPNGRAIAKLLGAFRELH